VQAGLRRKNAGREVKDLAEKHIRAIVFDLGETLLTFGRIKKRALFRASTLNSFNFIKQKAKRTPSFALYKLRNLLTLELAVFKSSITGNDFNAEELLQKINRSNIKNMSKDDWQQLTWLWYEPLYKLAKTEPDLQNTFQTLKNMGISLGILSNTFVTDHALEKHLDQLGVLKYFPTRMYSYQFDFRKPDPRIFKIAAEKINCPPENIMYVGDRIDNDILPTLKLNMTAVLKNAYTNAGKLTPPGAHRINKLADLVGLIEKLNTTQPSFSFRDEQK
jgi:putative hydrolase of the HAD superfamily